MKNRPATVSDVASLARASTVTGSRSLNPSSTELVSSEACERVSAATERTPEKSAIIGNSDPVSTTWLLNRVAHQLRMQSTPAA